jgi:hypothetical protein
MNTLFGKQKNYVLLGGILIGIILGFYRINLGLGFIVGFIISIVNMTLLEFYTAKILSQKDYRSFAGYLFYLFRNSLLIIPFVLSLVWPEFINVFSAVAGILYIKVILFASVLLPQRKD